MRSMASKHVQAYSERASLAIEGVQSDSNLGKWVSRAENMISPTLITEVRQGFLVQFDTDDLEKPIGLFENTWLFCHV